MNRFFRLLPMALSLCWVQGALAHPGHGQIAFMHEPGERGELRILLLGDVCWLQGGGIHNALADMLNAHGWATSVRIVGSLKMAATGQDEDETGLPPRTQKRAYHQFERLLSLPAEAIDFVIATAPPATLLSTQTRQSLAQDIAALRTRVQKLSPKTRLILASPWNGLESVSARQCDGVYARLAAKENMLVTPLASSRQNFDPAELSGTKRQAAVAYLISGQLFYAITGIPFDGGSFQILTSSDVDPVRLEAPLRRELDTINRKVASTYGLFHSTPDSEFNSTAMPSGLNLTQYP